jgi:hypothetical protein
MHTSPLVTLTRCTVERSRAHTVVTEEKGMTLAGCVWGGGDRQLLVMVS